MGRPFLNEVTRCLKNGATSPGKGDSTGYDYNGVWVIVNRTNPLRSNTYYPGR